jgi:hypothetical protein
MPECSVCGELCEAEEMCACEACDEDRVDCDDNAFVDCPVCGGNGVDPENICIQCMLAMNGEV